MPEASQVGSRPLVGLCLEHSWAVVARPQGHSLQCDKTRESLLLTPVFARLFVYVFVQGGRLPAVSAGASCAAQASTGGGEGDEREEGECKTECGTSSEEEGEVVDDEVEEEDEEEEVEEEAERGCEVEAEIEVEEGGEQVTGERGGEEEDAVSLEATRAREEEPSSHDSQPCHPPMPTCAGGKESHVCSSTPGEPPLPCHTPPASADLLVRLQAHLVLPDDATTDVLESRGSPATAAGGATGVTCAPGLLRGWRLPAPWLASGRRASSSITSSSSTANINESGSKGSSVTAVAHLHPHAPGKGRHRIWALGQTNEGSESEGESAIMGSTLSGSENSSSTNCSSISSITSSTATSAPCSSHCGDPTESALTHSISSHARRTSCSSTSSAKQQEDAEEVHPRHVAKHEKEEKLQKMQFQCKQTEAQASSSPGVSEGPVAAPASRYAKLSFGLSPLLPWQRPAGAQPRLAAKEQSAAAAPSSATAPLPALGASSRVALPQTAGPRVKAAAAGGDAQTSGSKRSDSGMLSYFWAGYTTERKQQSFSVQVRRPAAPRRGRKEKLGRKWGASDDGVAAAKGSAGFSGDSWGCAGLDSLEVGGRLVWVGGEECEDMFQHLVSVARSSSEPSPAAAAVAIAAEQRRQPRQQAQQVLLHEQQQQQQQEQKKQQQREQQEQRKQQQEQQQWKVSRLESTTTKVDDKDEDNKAEEEEEQEEEEEEDDDPKAMAYLYQQLQFYRLSVPSAAGKRGGVFSWRPDLPVIMEVPGLEAACSFSGSRSSENATRR